MASLDRYLYGYTGISGAGTQAHPGIPPDKVQGAPPNKAQDQKPLPPSDHTQSGSDTTPISPPAPAEHVALADEGPGRDDHQAGSPPLLLPNDLVEAIPGLYRVLDLIRERGSNGLVDKVIIEQDALGRLINDLRPNAYTSMTKVDFRALDSVHVKPLGLYGSKSSIVEFLRKKCGLDEQLTAALLLPSDDVGTAARASLRSGLYILKLGDGDPMYVIYWPEDNTWEDNCAQSTHTSRVAFMRYLTKLCDQVACLMSADHANTIVWRQPDETADDDDLEVDESDRMFTFEVLKTKEQEENVSAKMGFEVHIPPIAHDVPTNADIDILPPRLTRGETQQGVVTAVHVPGKEVLIPSDKTWEETALKNLVRGPLQLNPAISADSLELLLRLGMRERSPDAVKQYRSRLVEVDGIFKTRLQERNREVSARIEGEAAGLSSSIARYLMRELVKKYPVLRRDDALTPHDNNVQGASAAEGDGRLGEIALLYRPIRDVLHATLEDEMLNSVPSTVFRERKARILALDFISREHPDLTDQQREELLTRLLTSNSGAIDVPTDGLSRPARRWRNLWGMLSDATTSSSVSSTRTLHLHGDTLEMDDRMFLSCIGDFAERSPSLAGDVNKVVELTNEHLSNVVLAKAKELSIKFQRLQHQTCHAQVRQEVDAEKTRALNEARMDLVQGLMRHTDDTAAGARSTAVVEILDVSEVQQPSSRFGGVRMYKVKSSEARYSPPEDRYTIYPLELAERDIHLMREGVSDHVPSPIVRTHSASAFSLPGNCEVVYIHLLPDSRCLLVVRSGPGDCLIYAPPVSAIDHAIRKKAVKKLSRDKLGDHFLLAYDETKRVLALCIMVAEEPLIHLHTFAFDQKYTSLQGRGSHVNLSTWYDSPVTIKHMEFVSGMEELLFVDDLSRARIFSLVSQQFRPARLQLSRDVLAVYPSPEGSCFFVTERSTDDGETFTFRAYHWSSFGSSEGIKIDTPSSFNHGLCHVVTSFFASSNVHLMGLDMVENLLRSISLTITRKDTEFSFREEGNRLDRRSGVQAEVHNSLVDCHAELWTRFPVVPAVRRATTTSSSTLRRPRCLTLVSDESRLSFAIHFAALIQAFERTTRKPVGDELKNISTTSIDHSSFFSALPFVLSTFCAGEWIAELLCLIPVQIAMTKDNQFVPLKNGVWSTDFERSLLGAEVAQIVDSISFGWYESLFQSYMATKPVRVVSSMGEQSVGKSFALNHLVDASFAGSAMRTTEGVWMSVTPTDDSLIVALDFEGVHSMERSVQEDTLLVLFNTAISNLVLFRNNYAMSRDIAGLFHSFQSSASVLNPEANPMLFQSALMIIIKDVPDADTDGIKREFQHKFQQIVAAEQGNNFITRLHGNRLNIVPWPVIESKRFYTMFNAVKKRLDQQPITHAGGAIFLQTIKTLMAKLKANDWGAMSQNLASHRVHLLLLLLPKALAFGASEIVPDFEPLTDFDNATTVDSPDTLLHFFLGETGPKGQPNTQEEALHTICATWESYELRSTQLDVVWKQGLQQFLDNTVDLRIVHVDVWLQANTSRFAPTHSDIQRLFRIFNGATIDLKASVRMCNAQCHACNLGCLRAFHHEGDHDCLTSHVCMHMCQFVDEKHDGIERCGLSAGHPGSHLCNVTAHCCGKPCKLSDKKGCQQACVKRVDHDDEGHACSATIHECGHPCDLSAVTHSNGRTFSCGGFCRVASDVPHDVHRCENVQCPIECQLCKRLCSMHDHFHGLTIGAVHLCGQEHPCTALCRGGTCHIETSPHSVEATFTGRYESFQYTKYNQDAKRLPCAIIIPADKLEHEGDHTHDLGSSPFHFCDARCPDCGYYCTLPLGHTQQEHETSHGSMSKTKWAIEGPDGTVLEVGGRKFGHSDDGAPMLCSVYCRSLGRHVHVDWCRSDGPATCRGPEHEHVHVHMQPRPNEAKDWITHRLYWERTGFRDPYSQEDQAHFMKCDRMCSDPEHEATAQEPAQPSYCTLPILHPRHGLEQQVPGGTGYVSNDGHVFHCTNPAELRPAYHVIFVIDRSSSMRSSTPRPLDDTPSTRRIRRTHDNRLGAVFQSLQSFWDARSHMVGGDGARRDAYTVILFNHAVTTAISHDFARTPEQLLSTVLQHRASGGTDFQVALQTAQAVMETYWSIDRLPVIIFLSDGEGNVADETMRGLCRRSLDLGSPVSFHGVAFGPGTYRLQRMAEVARDVERQAPQEQLRRAITSSFTEALTTVQLADTFLGLADSLAKPRGALFRGRAN